MITWRSTFYSLGCSYIAVYYGFGLYLFEAFLFVCLAEFGLRWIELSCEEEAE